MRMPHFWINFYQVRAKSTITVKEKEWGNQVWTIQRRRQHWEQDTERRAIKYGQSRDVDNIGRKTQNEERSSMDNPET
jgi:hypothetical protein